MHFFPSENSIVTSYVLIINTKIGRLTDIPFKKKSDSAHTGNKVKNFNTKQKRLAYKTAEVQTVLCPLYPRVESMKPV